MSIETEPESLANSHLQPPVYHEVMLSPDPVSSRRSFSRRRFLQMGAGGALALAVYAGEIERHWIEIVRRDAPIPGLPAAFDGLKVAQISDIHLDEFTEPFFLRDAIRRTNQLEPDLVFLTGDFVTNPLAQGFGMQNFAVGAAWQCAGIFREGLKCRQVYAVLGNHDVLVSAPEVSAALRDNGIILLRNSYIPIERGSSRFWLAGLDDAVVGNPVPDLAVPAAIRNLPGEPVILLCHAPDFARDLSPLPAGQAVSLVLSGHTHGGQIRFPFIGPLTLPPGGKLFVEGEYRLGRMQLYVNRGLGTVGLPFRFDCPPEITLHTLRSA